MMDSILNPIVLDPPGFDVAAAWGRCHEYVAKCGGTVHQDGTVNWRAAFAADPGLTTCPACNQSLWRWGRRVRCPKCSFEFPVDWWTMYAHGVAEANRKPVPHLSPADAERMRLYYEQCHQERIGDPYYCYGYEHPVEDAWEEHDKIDWRSVMQQAGV